VREMRRRLWALVRRWWAVARPIPEGVRGLFERWLDLDLGLGEFLIFGVDGFLFEMNG